MAISNAWRAARQVSSGTRAPPDQWTRVSFSAKVLGLICAFLRSAHLDSKECWVPLVRMAGPVQRTARMHDESVLQCCRSASLLQHARMHARYRTQHEAGGGGGGEL